MLKNKNVETVKESSFIVLPFDDAGFYIYSYEDISKRMLEFAQLYYEEQIAPCIDELEDMEYELQEWSSYKDTSPEGVIKYLEEATPTYCQGPISWLENMPTGGYIEREDYLYSLIYGNDDDEDDDIYDDEYYLGDEWEEDPNEWYDENINDGWN